MTPPLSHWSRPTPLEPLLEPAGDKNRLVSSQGLPADQQSDVGEDPAQAQLVQVAQHVGGVAGELAHVAQRALRGTGGTHGDAGLQVPGKGLSDPGGAQTPSLRSSPL